MNISTVIQGNQKEISELTEMFDIIKELENSNFGHLNILLEKYEVYKNKDMFFELICYLNSVIHSYPLKLPVYYQLVKYLTPKIKQLFNSDELALIFRNKRIVLSLMQDDAIKTQTLINDFIDNIDTLEFFSDEFQEADSKWFKEQQHLYPELKAFMKSLNKKEHKKNRCNGIHHEIYAKLIRDDDLDKFQIFMAFTNQSIHSTMGFSPYESRRDVQYLTFIEYAALCGSITIFKFLWLNDAASTSDKLLQYAIAGGNYDIIHIVEGKYQYNDDCLFEAVRSHRNEIVEYIVESAGIDFTIDALFESIKSFNIEIFVQYAPKHLKNINEKSLAGLTALHVACQSGNFLVVKTLVQVAGQKPNTKDDNGRTALHYAARAGFMNIVKQLVKYTAINIEAKDKLLNAPIHLAALFCRLDVIKFIATLKRIDVNIIDRISIFFLLIREFFFY